MLEPTIRRKLESLRELPTIPFVISEVLSALDNKNLSASALASLIERDQTLTARVLRIANSPFYGMVRRISTIDLAVVVLGLNTIKEIVLSLIVQRLFSRVRQDVFDINSFWHYSVFCGAASRLLARNLGYRLAGEAFVAGLMHDIGILIEIEFFTEKFIKFRDFQKKKKLNFLEAELNVLKSTHCNIGSWLAEKWNLPDRLCDAIEYHHSSFAEVMETKKNKQAEFSEKISLLKNTRDDDIEQPLTAIVSMAEWFAIEMGFKRWASEIISSPLYLANEVLNEIKEHDLLNPESAIEVMKQDILEEYQKASALSELPKKPLY